MISGAGSHQEMNSQENCTTLILLEITHKCNQCCLSRISRPKRWLKMVHMFPLYSSWVEPNHLLNTLLPPPPKGSWALGRNCAVLLYPLKVFLRMGVPPALSLCLCSRMNLLLFKFNYRWPYQPEGLWMLYTGGNANSTKNLSTSLRFTGSNSIIGLIRELYLFAFQHNICHNLPTILFIPQNIWPK